MTAASALGALTTAPDARAREVAALCLLWGLLQAMDAMPRDALEGMLDALVGNAPEGQARGNAGGLHDSATR